jgi:hypothetical protein
MRQPRKLKKAISKVIISYDISACPKEWDLQQVFNFFETRGIILYDSYISGSNHLADKPKLANRVGKRVQIIKKK